MIRPGLFFEEIGSSLSAPCSVLRIQCPHVCGVRGVPGCYRVSVVDPFVAVVARPHRPHRLAARGSTDLLASAHHGMIDNGVLCIIYLLQMLDCVGGACFSA